VQAMSAAIDKKPKKTDGSDGYLQVTTPCDMLASPEAGFVQGISSRKQQDMFREGD